jgi:putative ABC transport system permease protein
MEHGECIFLRVPLFVQPYFDKKNSRRKVERNTENVFYVFRSPFNRVPIKNKIMLKNYLKIAFRNLSKHKVFSFINITGLALGMAVVMLISFFVYDEYSFDRFHKNFNEIYRITETQKQEDGTHPVAVTPGLLADALKNDFSEIEQTLRVGKQPGLLQIKDKKLETDNILVADPSLFSIFDFKLIRGNSQKIFQNPDEIILTENAVSVLFGEDWQKKEVIGEVITLNSFQTFPMRVVGIAQNFPANSHIQSDVLLPFKFLEKNDEWSMKWNSNSFHTYLKIKPQTDVQAFDLKMEDMLKKYKNDADTKLHLQALSDIYLKSKFDFQTDWGKRGDTFYVYLFITVGLIVLLIAVFNFINLATARAAERGKEVGVRKMAGAGRTSLVFQFLFEAFIIVLIASGLAFLLVYQFLPILNQISNKQLTILFDSIYFWLIFVVFIVAITLLSGVYPSIFLSSQNPSKAIKGVFSFSSGNNFRKLLVIGQFSLSVILVICTITIYKQLTFLQNKNLGFDKEHLMYFRLKGDAKGKALIFKNEVAKLTSIESATVTTNNLVNVSNSSNIEWEGQQKGADFLITQINTDPNFIETIGAKIISGRNFSSAIARDTSDQIGTYLVNETAAKSMGWNSKTAIGKKVKFWGLEGEIVGVVRDFHFRPLDIKIEPFIFRNRPKEFYFNLLIKTKPSQVQKAIEEVSQLYKKYDTNNEISYGFVNKDLDNQYQNEQKTGKIIFIFSILAIIISCMGLFGLVTFATQKRIKEIGIRKVLGASVASITTLLSKDFLKLVLIAIVIASPVAYYFMNKWLADFAYKINIEWWIFALAGFLAILIALLTVSYQAIKAALMNPVKSLKTE